MTHCRRIMLEELQRRNFAPTTISTYLHAVEQFARHFKCRPDRLNQFRRLRVRYDKRADIHEAFLPLGCALICWQSLRKTLRTA